MQRFKIESMNEMEANEPDATKRTYLARSIATLDELPGAIRSEESFVLFLAIDARAISDVKLREVSKVLLDQGCCYLCIWGPDCERVHDQFDSQRDVPERRDFCVMTTWHAEEGLREALDFFVYCAWPADGFAKSPVDWIAVSVANSDWDRTIDGGLSVITLGD